MKIDELLQQTIEEEKRSVFPSFQSSDAWNLGCLMVHRAQEQNLNLAISIDVNGQKLFYYAFDGTHLNNESAVARKMRVAHVFRCCSLKVFCELQLSGTTVADRGRSPMDYLALGGAVPIRLQNAGMIGTVCVSGLAHTDDHKFVISCLDEYLKN